MFKNAEQSLKIAVFGVPWDKMDDFEVSSSGKIHTTGALKQSLMKSTKKFKYGLEIFWDDRGSSVLTFRPVTKGGG